VGHLFHEPAACTVLAEAESTHARSFDMIWDTPQAIDFRFGMEITMYIANR